MIKGLKLSMKQMLMIVFIVCLIMPQAAMALETEGTATSPNWQFPDATTHWAKKHISKIALLGFAEGDKTGNYAPNKNISQQEVIIMLINMMGKKDQVNLNSEANLSFEVASWAKPYVVLALGEKLINMQEEIAKHDLNWGTKNATREWVTKLIVRAIGQETEATQAQNDDTGFTDEDMISAGYAGYINVAQIYDIVSGYKDGTFNPSGKITRAEMAVLLGEAEKHLTVRNSKITNGVVLSSNANSIQIQESTGTIKTLSLDANASIYNKGINDAIPVSSISIDDYVTVIADQGVAYYVEISDEQVKMESFVGTMESISLGDLTITVAINGASQSFKYVDDVAVMSNNGSGLSLTSLTVGSTLELKRNSDNVSTDITQIIVKAAPVFKTVVGTVGSIQTVNQVVEVKETSTGNTVAYPIPATIEITNGTRTLTSLSELYIGDEVTIELKDSIVTSFIVTKSSVIVEQGIVDSVDVKSEKNKIIFQATDNTFKGYLVSAEVQVLITGLDGADLEDIQIKDEVTIELNGNNLVTKITVLNRTIETKLGMEYYSYDSDALVVLLKNDKTSVPVAYVINDNTTIEAGSSTVMLSNLSTYFTKGKRVDITYSGNRIMSMKISNNYDGKLVDINTTTKTIKLNSDYYGAISLNYTTVPSIEIFGKTNATLSDLPVGSMVSVILDGNQDKATQIKLIQTKIFKVKTKYSYKLAVTDETSTALDISYSASIPITHNSKLNATYADITDNSYIEATMVGATTTAIYIPAVTIGKLTAVNSSNGSLTIEEFGKTSKSISNITSVRVNKNSNITTTLNSTTMNDRVSVVIGTNGVHWITIIAPISRSVISYTDATKTLVITRVLTTEKNQFVLSDQAYIHKGTSVLSAASFVEKEKIAVYILDDKIVEIEKL
ncbi:MAG: S-layer homology domain-containing protein [Paenibacillaceae bacterium]